MGGSADNTTEGRMADDLICREDAKAACQKVADEAKSYGIPQMTMGANTCRDAIIALPAAEPSPALGVKVKPLVWDGQFGETAQTPWGCYSICDRAGPDGSWDWLGWSHSDRTDSDFSDDVWRTQKLAQAAAQADYDARIRAALEPDTSPALGAAWMRNEAADRLDAIADSWAKDYTLTREKDAFRNAADYVRAIPAPTPADLLDDAASVLLLHSESIGIMPDAARLAGVQAYIERDQRCRSAALSDAWFAALRALAALPKGDA